MIQPIFFAQKAQLNPDAMREYNLEKTDSKSGGKQVTSGVDNIDYIERFDARGRKVRYKMGKIENPHLMRLGYSYAVVNF